MQPSTKKNLIIAACYAGTMVLGMIVGPKFQKENANTKPGSFNPFFREEKTEKVEHVLNIIEENYVDPVQIDSMQDMAINQILKKLDPHSSYLPPVEAKRFSEDLDGNYSGIGVEYQLLNDTVFVTSLNNGGPAAKAGLKTGDQILQVDNKSIAGRGITTKRIISLIKGPRGTEVKLHISRNGELKDIIVKRDKITISSIDAAFPLSDYIGYIKISKFGARTNDDFAAEFQRLQKKGINSLILDLRGNGGGYLNAATALADQFIADKKLIVYTEGKHEPRTDYLATEEGVFEKGKLIVLIDENSASASEILAGAIQDLDRGLIIGRRSFGKGLVQEQFNFGDGSALNLTVARYFTPSGRSIQKPYKDGKDKYFQEVAERYKNGEVKGKLISALINKGQTFKTSGGRMIYGGGGITPDIFIPIDSTVYNEFYYSMNAKGILTEFVFKSITGILHPAALNQFISEFSLSDTQYSKLISLAASRGLKFKDKEADNAKPAINTQVKAIAARYYYGDEGFYLAKNVEDKVIARALEAIKK